MKNHLPFQRQRDGRIIDAVQTYPMLDITLMRVLVPMPYRVAARRLHSLSEYGAIYRYPDGLNHVVGYSSIKFGKADKPQIAHRLMASKLWITADLCEGIEVTSRLYDHQIRPKVNEAKLPLSPDGFAWLNSEPFFLEFYRSGTSLTRPTSTGRSIVEKCWAYVQYAEQLKELFGIQNFRVLIIVETQARRDNARVMLRENGFSETQAFLIGAQEDYNPEKPEALLGSIFAVPKHEGLVGLAE